MRHYFFVLIGTAFIGSLLLLSDRYPDGPQASRHGPAMPVASIGEVFGRL
jgi:hypothetical protein